MSNNKANINNIKENEPYLVSVICVSYNHEEYIIDCLESIRNQTYKNIELIVADDKSKDGTFYKVKEWCKYNNNRFIRCIYYTNDYNMGVVKNLNTAIRKASGKYIKIIATDDFLMDNAISEMVRFVELNDVDFLFSNGYIIDKRTHYPIDNEIKHNLIYEDRQQKISEGKELFDSLYELNFIAAPTCFVPRETYAKYGVYSEKYCFEDYEYNLRLAANNARIAYLDSKTTAYRVLDSSGSHFHDGKIEEQRYKMYNDSMMQILKDYSIYTSSTMDNFYKTSIITGVLLKYKDFLKEFYYKEKSNMSIKCKVLYYFLVNLKLGVILRAVRMFKNKILNTIKNRIKK